MRAQPSNGRSIQPALKTHSAGISAGVVVEILTNAAAELGRRSVCRPPLACGTVNS
jgi:hypothetical protein